MNTQDHIRSSQRPFFDLDPQHADYDTAKTVIIPAGYQGTVSYGQGTAEGPQAILEASWNVELYDVILQQELHLQGIHGTAPLDLPADPAQAVEAVKDAVAAELARDKFPVVLGGEHSLSAGAVAAASEHVSGISVLQLDAHADLRDTYEGTPHSHACVMRRIADMGLPFTQVGIRSMCFQEAEYIKARDLNIFYAHKIRKDPNWIAKIIESLSDKVYVTLDIDVLDPSEMPATGTPEPGGLYYYDLVELLVALKKSGKQIIAADLMEFAPISGFHAPDFLAAKLLYLLCSLRNGQVS